MKEWNNRSLWLRGLRFQYVKKNSAFYFVLKTTQRFFWNYTNNARFLQRNLPYILRVGLTSFFQKISKRHVLPSTAYSWFIFSYLLCKIFCVWGWFALQEIDKFCWRDVTERNVAELFYSAICQIIFWSHFIRATACNKRLARFYPLNPLWRSDKFIAVYYIIYTP
jgi:hypothetical protein